MRWALFSSALALVGCLTLPARGDEPGTSRQLQTVIGTCLEARHDIGKISGVALHVDVGGRHPIDLFTGTDGRDGKPTTNLRRRWMEPPSRRCRQPDLPTTATPYRTERRAGRVRPAVAVHPHAAGLIASIMAETT